MNNEASNVPFKPKGGSETDDGKSQMKHHIIRLEVFDYKKRHY